MFCLRVSRRVGLRGSSSQGIGRDGGNARLDCRHSADGGPAPRWPSARIREGKFTKRVPEKLLASVKKGPNLQWAGIPTDGRTECTALAFALSYHAGPDGPASSPLGQSPFHAPLSSSPNSNEGVRAAKTDRDAVLVPSSSAPNTAPTLPSCARLAADKSPAVRDYFRLTNHMTSGKETVVGDILDGEMTLNSRERRTGHEEITVVEELG